MRNALLIAAICFGLLSLAPVVNAATKRKSSQARSLAKKRKASNMHKPMSRKASAARRSNVVHN